MLTLDPNATLILIDLQQAVDHPSWGPRNHPQAEAVVATLLAAWRAAQRPLIHVRHDSVEPQSTYRPGQAGHAFKAEAMPLLGEMVVPKQTNSAFIGTKLEERLRAAGVRQLLFAGVSTSNSVEATVRMAGNLGFSAWLIEDACFTFAKRDWGGTLRHAQEVHDLSLANLHGEYCTVTTSTAVFNAL